jgi:hypothetical protein
LFIDQVFHPAFDGRADPLNIVAVGGSCAFREPDGRCGIHARMGGGAKPQSCLSYPAHLIACGAEWHASLRPECACVARSAIHGTPLEADPEVWVRLRSTLTRVWAVPRSVAIDANRSLPRDDYVSWMRETVARLKTSFDPIGALEEARRRLGGDEIVEELGFPSESWLREVADHLGSEAVEAARTFDSGSPYRRSIEWGAEVAARLARDGPVEPRWSRGRAGDWARRTSSTISLLLHGHGPLEQPFLGPAIDDLLRILRTAHAGEGIRPTEDVDPRLESVTMWLFLWRNVWMTTRM